MQLCARKIRRSKSTGEGSSASKISGSRSAGQLRTRLPHQQTRRRLLQRPRNWRRRSGCVSRPPHNLRARYLCYRLLSLFLLRLSFRISLSLPPPLAPYPCMSPPLTPYFFSSARPPPFLFSVSFLPVPLLLPFRARQIFCHTRDREPPHALPLRRPLRPHSPTKPPN